jgi:organic radical activating enzyme
MDVADPVAREANVASAIAYCLSHPRWRLSVQTHKVVGVR